MRPERHLLQEQALVPLLPAMLGGLVGLIGASRPAPWYDEAATLSAIDRSPAQLLDMVQRVDVVHATYYFAAMGWTVVAPESVQSLRTLSAVGVALTAGLVTLLALRTLPRRTALSAGIATALLPGLAVQALEARGYAWTAAAAVAMTLALLAAIENGRRRDWVAYSVLCAAGLWLFLYLGLLVLAHGAAVMVGARQRGRAWFASASLAWLTSVPLAVMSLDQVGQIGPHDPDLVELVGRLAVNQWFASLRSHEAALGPLQLSAGLLAVSVWVLVVRGLRSSLRGDDRVRQLALVCAMWIALPMVVVAAVSLTGRQFYQERYFTFVTPAVALLLVLGVASLPRRWSLLAAAALVALTLPVLAHHRTASPKFDDYRTLAASVQSHRPDLVVFSHAGARGVRVTYPRSFEGVEDWTELTTSVTSGTLWGIQRPARALTAAEVSGKSVLVFTPVRFPDPYLRRLLRLGCRETGQRTVDHRYAVVPLSC